MAIIITDSTCDLPPSMLADLGVEMLPIQVTFGTEEYLDKITITNEEFYEKLVQEETFPTTTLISIGQFSEVYDKYPNDDLIVLPISSKLSGTYQSAIAAKEISGRQNIYVLDTDTVTVGLGMLVKYAVQMNQAGLPAVEIVDTIAQYAQRLCIFAVVDTLKYLVKGGRLSGIQGALGSMLGIKPILSVTQGEVHNIAKARSLKAGIQDIIRRCTFEKPMDETMMHCFVHTGGNIPALQTLMESVPKAGDFGCFTLGSVVAAHVGPGAVAIAYFSKS